MVSDFVPIVSNPHLLTIAGNFWPRALDTQRFPATPRRYQVDPNNSILVYEHQPETRARGQIIFLHGLEGSADAGYIQSFAQHALESGFGVHRVNARTCGGTEECCQTMYHSGLTSDPKFIAQALAAQYPGPLFLVGFSLGGNVALKLGGELGHNSLFSGICAVSTPIDLASCVRTLDKKSNILYARRFLSRLCDRVRRKSAISPDLYSSKDLDSIKSIWEFDDRITAPLFGFGTAANYYATQSANRFLDAIRTPTLVIAAQDDPLVPFGVYHHPAFQSNPCLNLIAPMHGGHLGFISRRRPRFWLDNFVLSWIERTVTSSPVYGTNQTELASL